MTISSSLNAGVMGLNVNASRLATISDNIANSNTYGYKRSDVDFSSLVINQRPSIYSAGGVRATSIKEVSDSGSLITTGQATDIAINGNGMIPVTNLAGVSQAGAERDFMMLPTGSFSADENGYLRTISGMFLLGWPVDSSGNPITSGRGSTTGLVPVNTSIGQFSATPTENVRLGVNLPADPTVITPTDPYTLPVEYFDASGLAQTMTFTFQPGAASNQWTISVTDNAVSPTTPVATFDIEFGTGGTLSSVTPTSGTSYDPATGEVVINSTTGPINTFVGFIGENAGLTQLGSSFVPYDVSRDGAPVGELQNIEISPEGYVEAVYNSGFRRVLYQVPVANVNNPDGLTALGNQAFQISASSGDIYLWDAGTGPSGDFVGYALMESNTDIASELTSLIETQRAYSSNATIIRTVDEMLQETTNLKR